MHEPMDVRSGGEYQRELMREAKMARRAREAAGGREDNGSGELKRLYDRLLGSLGRGRRSGDERQ